MASTVPRRGSLACLSPWLSASAGPALLSPGVIKAILIFSTHGAGLHPADLQALYLPILEKEPRVSDRDISRGISHGAGVTPQLCVADGGQDMAVVFVPRGRERLPVTRGIDLGLAYQLPGKLAEGHTSHCPFDKLSRCRCSDLR